MLELSVVLATLNRLPFLKRALQSISVAAGKLRYEIIVVEGGGTDGTLDWLQTPKIFPGGRNPELLRILAQQERTGAVAAFNSGFAAARGEFVAAFNDDAEYVRHPLEAAVMLLRSNAAIGQVAIPFATQRIASVEEIRPLQNLLPEIAKVNLPVVGKVPYANFGVISKELGDRLGWWGDFYQYAGDTHLSTSVWAVGLRVAELSAREGYIIHYEAQDNTRLPNVEAPHYHMLWYGPNSPFLAKPTRAPVSSPKVPVMVPRNNPLTRQQMQRAASQRAREIAQRQRELLPKVLVRYLGNKHGNLTYQRPGALRQYVFGAAHREKEVDSSDVAWLLGLRTHGKRLFEKVEKEQNG